MVPLLEIVQVLVGDKIDEIIESVIKESGRNMQQGEGFLLGGKGKELCSQCVRDLTWKLKAGLQDENAVLFTIDQECGKEACSLHRISVDIVPGE